MGAMAITAHGLWTLLPTTTITSFFAGAAAAVMLVCPRTTTRAALPVCASRNDGIGEHMLFCPLLLVALLCCYLMVLALMNLRASASCATGQARQQPPADDAAAA